MFAITMKAWITVSTLCLCLFFWVQVYDIEGVGGLGAGKLIACEGWKISTTHHVSGYCNVWNILNYCSTLTLTLSL